ncbi:hypothetical protein ACXET9_13935 [Brachybacterium sp. DNPG3]
MRRDEHGAFIVTPEEMFILRQGLFIAKHHTDPAVADDLPVLTGVTPEEIAALMERADELGRPWR